MRFDGWIDYDYRCPKWCGDCIYIKACDYPEHVAPELWSHIRDNCHTKKEVDDFIRTIPSMSNHYHWAMECEGRGRERGFSPTIQDLMGEVELKEDVEYDE